MDIWRSFGGMMETELVSADPAAALYAVNEAGITIYDAVQMHDEITTRFRIRRQDYKKLQTLSARRGYSLRIVGRKGLFWTGKTALKRPVLLLGVLILLALALYLPSRVYFFKVEGNVTIPTRLILEKCTQCGISFGASRSEVRSEKMKNALLEAIPELQWAGINTSGCTATISVRERTVTQVVEEATGVCSIVALRDAVITECTVTKGNALCKVGQAVKAGQVLVSGYTDCGIAIRATRAQAEIYGQTDRDLEAVTPSQWQERGTKTVVEKKYSIIIGKNRINFYKGSGISDASCDKMYEEYYVTLPGGFQLPVCLVTETWTYYESMDTELAEEAAAECLSAFARRYVPQQMIAGQILAQQETVTAADGIFCLLGDYSCLEIIGQVQKEEIIKPNGKYD